MTFTAFWLKDNKTFTVRNLHQFDLSIMLSSKKADSTLINGYLRDSKGKPMIIWEIMGIVLDFYHQESVLLRINDHPDFCTIDTAKDLFADKTHIKMLSGLPDEGYPFVMADIDPVMSGVHCWRIRV